MAKQKRIYEMDAVILEALKIVSKVHMDGIQDEAEEHRLDKKKLGTSKDVLLRMIASLKKA